MHVIGTAGHVDHGKSTLVKALTGMDPDRLKEEKQRQMTIDLGFAWFTLPSGQEVGLVDVPGHRDFMENMLAGMSGVDLALLVIALDEGIMPQTREHLAVLDLLAVKGGIIVLTKSDLVSDAQWVEMVISDVKKLVGGTILDHAPIICVSAFKGIGIHDLINLIEDHLKNLPERLDKSRPRLAVDRVFTLSGFGTIVTGTLIDGQFNVGDEIEVMPSGLHARIRGLQTHKQKEQTAVTGSRTAVNLAGISVDQLHRGDVLVHPDTYQPSSLLEVSFRMLRDSTHPLHHRDPVKLFIGTAEINAHARLLTVDEIQPGEAGFLQLELSKPTLAVRGDRFILRRPSPAETVGGGEILDANPKRRLRKSPKVELEILQNSKIELKEDDLLQALHIEGLLSLSRAMSILNKHKMDGRELISRLIHEKKIIVLGSVKSENGLKESQLMDVAQVEEASQKIGSLLNAFYRENPLRMGMKLDELKARLAISPKKFDLLLRYFIEQGDFLVENGLILLPRRKIQFSPKQEKTISELLKKMDLTPFETPSVEECIHQVGKDVFQSLLDQQVIIQVSREVVFESNVYYQMEKEIISILEQQGNIALAQVRDLFHTTRKYALAVLEHLDRKGISIREGDYRRLKKKVDKLG